MQRKSVERLTEKQLEALKATPLGPMPNKVALALTMLTINQGDAAEAIGVSKANFNQIANGKRPGIQVETARLIADWFGCTIEDLFPSPDPPVVEVPAETVAHS